MNSAGSSLILPELRVNVTRRRPAPPATGFATMMTRLLRTAPAALAALAVLLGLGGAPSYAAHPQGPAVGVPAEAGTPTAGVAGVDGPAGGLGGNSIFTAFATRSRVVQFCAVAMCLALFILVK